MKQSDVISQLKEWANDFPSYLSNRDGYPRGYRDGIIQAKETVLDILSQLEESDK